MKKLLSVILLAVFVLVCSGGVAVAEEPDLVGMDFETLSELKRAVDAELNARPEAEKFDLYPGEYTVGTDIKAGRYYVILNHPTDSYGGVRFSIYKTKKEYDERPYGKMGETIFDQYIDYQEKPVSISLVEGNYIKFSSDTVTLKATEFTEADYYRYETPEGTYVAAGIYSVGENGDIPAGSYEIYTATETKTTAGYFFSQQDYKEKDTGEVDPVYSSVKAGEKIVMRLEEGYVFIIDGGDAIMKKSKKLVFD